MPRSYSKNCSVPGKERLAAKDGGDFLRHGAGARQVTRLEGDGGDARVAAISLEPHDLARARQVAQQIAAELRT